MSNPPTLRGLAASPWPVAALTDPESRVAAVRQAWFDEGRRISGGVAEPVLGSWQRCLQAGLRPDQAPVFQPVARKRAAYLEDRDHVLLKAARAPFTELETALAPGRIAWISDLAGALLGMAPVQAMRQPAEAALGLGLDAVLALTRAHRPAPALLPSGLRVWLQAEFRALGDDAPDADASAAPLLAGPDGDAPPVAASIRTDAAAPAAETQPDSPDAPDATLAQLNQRAVEHTLALCGGNVSQAARMLGVSRGLLYRRLRKQGGP